MRWIVLFLLVLLQPVAWAADKTILVIESYHADFFWAASYRQALTESLAGKYKLEFFEMNTKRLPLAKHAEMGEKALARAREIKPVLVIMADDAALKYVGPKLNRIGIPGVYLGINNNPRKYGIGHSSNITGVLERPLIMRGVSFVQRIMPETQKVLLLFDGDLTSEVIREEIFAGKASKPVSGVQVDLKLCQTEDDWKRAVADAKANGYQAMVVGLYHSLKRRNGKVADADEVIVWTSAHSPVPLFALWDFAVGSNMAIGGLVMSGAEQGKAAAVLVRKILEEGTEPASIFPVTAKQGALLFSKKQLTRFGLQLPPEIAAVAKLID